MEENPKYNKITDVLKEQGRSQKWLSDRLHISTNALNNWCTQKAQPSIERFFEIAEILGVGVCDLINTDYKSKKK